MRYVIYGAGAVGSSLGGYLSQTGCQVVLIGRADHIAQIRAVGLTVKDGAGIQRIPVQAVESLADISYESGDVVFLCVKSQDTPAAAADLREWATAELPVFCFQNGVHNEEVVGSFSENVYGVLVAVGVRYVAPGYLIHYAPKALTLGRYPTGLDALVEAIGRDLEAAGYAVTYSTNVMAAKWAKLIMNLSNAFYAITGLSIVEGNNIPEAREFVAELFAEGIRVLDAAGIEYERIPNRLSPQEAVERLRTVQKPHPLPEDADFYYYPSTWQDLQLQRGSSEVAAFNGEIVTLGRVVGVPTPLNSLLQRVVEQMAENHELPGKYRIGELRKMLA